MFNLKAIGCKVSRRKKKYIKYWLKSRGARPELKRLITKGRKALFKVIHFYHGKGE